jgi:AcrR family transcriptional regulator
VRRSPFSALGRTPSTESLIHFLTMAYRPTERTKARQAATRQRIVAAARDQVAVGGYASAGMQVVAARAGVAVGTVYRHFPSKAVLFAEVFRRASRRELDVVVEVCTNDRRPAWERIAAAVEAFCRRALARPVLAHAQIAEPVAPIIEAERLRLRRGYRDAFARLLGEGVASGEFAPTTLRPWRPPSSGPSARRWSGRCRRRAGAAKRRSSRPLSSSASTRYRGRRPHIPTAPHAHRTGLAPAPGSPPSGASLPPAKRQPRPDEVP